MPKRGKGRGASLGSRKTTHRGPYQTGPLPVPLECLQRGKADRDRAAKNCFGLLSSRSLRPCGAELRWWNKLLHTERVAFPNTASESPAPPIDKTYKGPSRIRRSLQQ